MAYVKNGFLVCNGYGDEPTIINISYIAQINKTEKDMCVIYLHEDCKQECIYYCDEPYEEIKRALGLRLHKSLDYPLFIEGLEMSDEDKEVWAGAPFHYNDEAKIAEVVFRRRIRGDERLCEDKVTRSKGEK